MQKTISLGELKHSPTNVRKVKPSDNSFKALCASISSKGLLHNLIVVKNGQGYEVIDGNRRLDALNAIHDKDFQVSCIEVPQNDAELGLHANMMREDMHPLDECDVIQALVADGSEDYDSVGSRFGQTNLWVKQRISLAELSDKAKEMFRNGQINLSTAQALTLGSHDRQDKYLTEAGYWDAGSAKRAMTEQKIPLDACLFEIDEENYHSGPLGIVSDLFGEEKYITNRDLFEAYQQAFIDDYVTQLSKEGFYDVVSLKDQYYWDAPELKRFRLCYREQFIDSDEYDISEVLAVVTYNTYRYKLDVNYMIPYETADQLEQQKEIEEQEGEVTPLDFSQPQKELVKSYYTDAMIRAIWDGNTELDSVKFFKALLCHRKLGYSNHHVHRVGHVYADPQRVFPADGEPDGYIDYPFIDIIDEHRKMANDAYSLHGTTPLEYCYNLWDSVLDQLFVACCLQGISRNDFKSEATEFAENIVNLQRWFKPDETWVKKWKVNQLEMMEEYLFGGKREGTKAHRVENITTQLQSGQFDPFGTWPPNEQS